MRIKYCILGILLSLVLFATGVQAQVNCDDAFGMPIGVLFGGAYVGAAGGSAIPGTPFCGGLGISNAVDIFEINLTATALFTVDVTTTGSGVLGMGIFSDCDANACLTSVAPVGLGAQLEICLPAGIYYVILNEMTNISYSYNLSGSLSTCGDPVVATEGSRWGNVKALFR